MPVGCSLKNHAPPAKGPKNLTLQRISAILRSVLCRGVIVASWFSTWLAGFRPFLMIFAEMVTKTQVLAAISRALAGDDRIGHGCGIFLDQALPFTRLSAGL